MLGKLCIVDLEQIQGEDSLCELISVNSLANEASDTEF